LGEDGSYEFVRVHEIDGRQQILFRLLNTEGVNYHDLILIRDPAGRTQAVDVYVYLSGELFSTTIRRMIRRLTAENKRSIFQKLFAVQQDSLEDIDKLYRMAQSLQQRKPAEALEVYATASEEAQHDKTFLIARYQAATMLPDEAGSYREIEATVGLFRQKHPQDPALDFLAIDEHVVRNEYDRALQAVDRLDRAVGGDAYLHEIRAGILCQAGKPDLAAEQFELAIAGLPHRESAYFGLITLSLYQEDYGNVLKALKRLDQAIELEWNDLHDVPAYAGFVASPYFKQWTKYLESKPAP
jgi:tetratricopeptide (TPR) repeat protein